MLTLGVLGTVPAMAAAPAALQVAATTTVQVVINVPANTPDTDAIYLTGTGFNGCQWQPTCVRLTSVGYRAFGATLTLDSPAVTSVVFKPNRGDWTRVPVDAAHNDIPNLSATLADLSASSASTPSANPFVVSPGVFVYSVINWSDQAPLGVTGHLDRIDNVYSSQLSNTRSLFVWLPPSYVAHPELRYPVIYMQDGQNVFDPATSTMGVDWGIDETMTRLIAQGKVREAIVVGVTSVNRDNEYDYSRLGVPYADFLIHTVKPLIDSRYRTLTDRDSTYLMGSSSGALIAFEMIWANPLVFSRCVGASLPAGISNGDIYRVFQASPRPSVALRMYMDRGTLQNDAGYGADQDRWHTWVLQQGLLTTAELKTGFFPYAGHNEIEWARRADYLLTGLLAP